jgi:hypothetical protein
LSTQTRVAYQDERAGEGERERERAGEPAEKCQELGSQVNNRAEGDIEGGRVVHVHVDCDESYLHGGRVNGDHDASDG